MERMERFRRLLLLMVFPLAVAVGQHSPVQRALIVVEGSSDLKNPAMGIGRQLQALLGHFPTVSVTTKGVNSYVPGEMNGYDVTFYCGFNPVNTPPDAFLQDVMAGSRPVVWMSTGFKEFCARFPVAKRFGFRVATLDSITAYSVVRTPRGIFQRQEMTTSIVSITNAAKVSVVATAQTANGSRQIPYILRSGSLLYIADSPFAYAGPSDRYLYFADMLHDILGIQHDEYHGAIIRIEDVNVYENPNALREIADILSSRGIPFLVGVIPFYVDPGQGVRLSLSDAPELVDALQYMVHNGGTIVMHGSTHQYKGTTAVDYEFWDESTNGPIRGETSEGDARKIENGIQEFMKNGLYPLVWETPHYTASMTLYKTVAKYFSTACEQRLSVDDADFSQYFPYIIRKDLYGQTIYPENLGYVPLNPNKDSSEQVIRDILADAKSHLAVRDGVVGVFFHPFLDLDLLKQLADGLQGLGYSFLDLREQTNWVHLSDRVILSGSQGYTVHLTDQYLQETWFNEHGQVRDRSVSDTRLSGAVTRTVTLGPDEFYKAEPTEFREREPGFLENLTGQASRLFDAVFAGDQTWQPMRPVILWNHFARGGFYRDQASLAAIFSAVNVPVDTIFLGQPVQPGPHTVLVVPAAFTDSLKLPDYTAITSFVQNGGNVLLDGRTDLAEEFGLKFTPARLRVVNVRDKMFPEERIAWRDAELVAKFEADGVDKVFCSDEATNAPLVVGMRYGKGRVLFISSRFDPSSMIGIGRYPFLLDHLQSYFQVRPIVERRDLEMYFDPGFRHSYSIEQLVAQWVKLGIRTVHVAGWHQYPKYTYDYDRLIRLAHANGILVYAWLEPPQVSQKFWNDHPQWREKNYRGEDARPSWRYPVALTDTACLAAVTREFDAFLRAHDFDGVNLAELYFEAGRGFEDAKYFTPMHPSARAEFRRLHGFDPAVLFDPKSSWFWRTDSAGAAAFVDYRVSKLDHVYRTLLPVLQSVAAGKPGFEVIVTAMDSKGSPELRTNIGVDMDDVLRLRKEFGFLLQVEDPESRWSTDPRRYVAMGRQYASLVGDTSKLMLDLNILSFRKPEVVTLFPTLGPTGTESFQLVRSASLGAPRLTIYSEATVNPQDMRYLSNALAADVTYRQTDDGYTVESPRSFSVTLPPTVHQVTLDGTPVSPFRGNEFLIPAGAHTLQLSAQGPASFSTSTLDTRLMSITGSLLSISHGLRDIAFRYESPRRTIASLSNLPTEITVDGAAYSFTVMKGDDCYSVALPPGTHDVRIVAGDRFSYGVSVTSLWSTTAIALFGAAAVLLLFGMYLVLKVVRRRAAA